MPRPSPYPFARLPEGQLAPRPPPGDIIEGIKADTEVVKWFIEARWGRRLRPGSPLAGLLDACAAFSPAIAPTPMDELAPEVARHGLYLSNQLLALAWSIRALHQDEGLLGQVAGSFIDGELLHPDTSQPDAELVIAGGVGTMATAARLLRAGGGRIESINGKGRAGHDIRWRTGDGDLVLVERKDRAYEASLRDTMERRTAYAVERAKEARFPDEPGVARLLFLGIPCLVCEGDLAEVNGLFERAFASAFGPRPEPHGLAHLVVVEMLGLEPRRGGDRICSWVPVLLERDERVWRTVGPLVVRAIRGGAGVERD